MITMPSSFEDPLFRLVNSMSKSEKRHFRLYVNRLNGGEEVLFMKLFDVLDKQKNYDEEIIFKKVTDLKRHQLSNLKRHLYRQILTSLRLVNTSKFIDLHLREQIDFAKILYAKGLYIQSLKILDKAKGEARESHQDIIELEIIDFEIKIETRHITRSIENRADELTKQSQRRSQIINSNSQFANLALRLYGLYIKVGHIRHKKDFFMVKEFFETNLPKVKESDLTFFEKIHFYESHVWYNHIIQNFLQSYRYASKWIELFKGRDQMLLKDPELYLRGVNHLISAAFMTGYQSKLKETLEEIKSFREENDKILDTNAKLLIFQYYYTGILNLYFTEGRFSEGLKIIPELKKELQLYGQYLDQHHVMVMQYKVACLYFGAGDNESSLDYLNEIIQLKSGALREDIQCFARFLHLIAHYELGNYNLLEYLVKSVYRFLAKREDLSQVQQEILGFLRNTLNRRPNNLEQSFKELRTRLTPLARDPYERRSFLYLDILGWLDSKIQNRPVQDIIREKYLQNKR